VKGPTPSSLASRVRSRLAVRVPVGRSGGIARQRDVGDERQEMVGAQRRRRPAAGGFSSLDGHLPLLPPWSPSISIFPTFWLEMNYIQLEKLGEGTYASVFKVRPSRASAGTPNARAGELTQPEPNRLPPALLPSFPPLASVDICCARVQHTSSGCSVVPFSSLPLIARPNFRPARSTPNVVRNLHRRCPSTLLDNRPGRHLLPYHSSTAI
jgi:hypothetical protein